ncbi:tripartite tricarboxylate transporter substrate binding protein [Ramlibacter sp. AW1]|uniref:Tripartite tricarboxylate transporter substrate binding protein n=1 Tax=Ramlibacter aurantiacus TaxID=2801330 RepID=A0A936ZTY8_9BURK|nr:tripartite tricarboxylate transporter substrate binding protein [Ramlibacter aurantiacus]MBL0421110.1 tripartite tricarboxylate transporter substrate binding protein [Ramlibacter aurantiacus]
MKMFTRAAIAALSLAVAAPMAYAQDWPAKPVKLVVPTGPGSSPDIFARLLGNSLQPRISQSVVIENKPGASGSLGIDQVAKSAGDGYTLGVAYPAPLTTNLLMMKKMPYDAKKDLQLITNAVQQPTVLIIGKHLEARNLPELVALVKKNPGKYNSASAGAASLGRLLAEAFAAQVGSSIQNVVYNGAAPTLVAMVRGDVDFAFLPAAGVMAFVKDDKVRLVGVAADKRSTLLPNVPTLKENGLDIDGSNWLGIVAPASVPADVAARMRREINAALNAPETKKILSDNYMEVIASTPAEFASVVDADITRWKPLIEKLQIRID